jgi:UDP:flavonoid glycosyltransferase YjiC (YdhE family)
LNDGGHEVNMQVHMTRRFLFSSTGGYGHIHPLMPLASALKGIGHQIAFVSRASLAPMVEAEGYDYFPVGGDIAGDPEFQQVKAEMAAIPTTFETEMVNYTRLFCGVGPRLRAPDLINIAERWQADMIIREAAEYGSLIAAEKLSLPHATVAFTSALQCMSIFERDAASQLDLTRARWGLAPDPALSALYRYLHLSYAPPTFGTHDVGDIDGFRSGTPIAPTTHFIRTELFDNVDNETLPGWIAQLPKQPTVYVTLGTEISKEPEFWPGVMQTIIAGLRDAPINLIVTIGRGQDPALFGLQPANVHIEQYIPQSLLLSKCDLMVMHGGSNSLLAGLEVGLPMVIVPLIADQFFNANIIESMQIGQVVRRAQLTPVGIRAAVDEVLNNPVYRRNTAKLKAEMHALPGIQHAVDLIERVAATRQSVVNPDLYVS